MSPYLYQDLNTYYEQQNYTLFFQHIDPALNSLKEQKQFEELITLSIHKAVLYINAHNLLLASQTLSDIKEYMESDAQIQQKIRYYNVLAVINGKVNNLDLNFQYLTKAMHLAEKIDNRHALTIIYHNLSEFYFQSKHYDKSLLYIQKCLAYYQMLNEKNEYYPLFLLHYVQVLLEIQDIKQAQATLLEIKSLLETKTPHEANILLRKTEALLLLKENKPQQAYTLLKNAIEQFSYNLIWSNELYIELCKLSKAIQPIDVYFEDLKQYDSIKTALIEQQRKEQFRAIRYYMDDNMYKESLWKDPLTNVYNRRSLKEKAFTFDGAMVTFLFDMDHFKSINDEFGHPIGDQALQAVATTTNEFFKHYNVHFARLGGDEFVGIFSIESSESLLNLFEAYLNEIRSIQIPFEQTFFQFTISVGVIYSQQAIPINEAMALADEALYRSKNNGRNRFTLISTNNPSLK